MSDEKPKADYVIGNKKPPPGRPFQKGKSGNPSGRPKNLSRFGDVLMKEFFKTVDARVGGEMVRASQSQLFAQQMVKNGITKGPTAMKLVLQFIEAHEAREAAKEALKEKKAAEGGTANFSWDEEKERVLQELEASVKASKQALQNG